MVCSRYPKEFRYYETVLKKKCFRKLQNNVWENKTKWKLTERADYHYKLRLLYQYLNLWKKFLKESYEKKIKRQAADFLFERKLKAKGVKALKRNAEFSWMFARVCRKKIEWNVKFRTWHQWMHYTQKRIKIREIKDLANKIRHERLIIRFFYIWSFRVKEKTALEISYKKLAGECEAKIKRKCFNSWKVFTGKKTWKRKIERLSIAFNEDKLKMRIFHSWKNYTSQKNLYKNRVKFIENFYENYLIETYLSRWFVIYEKFKIEKDFNNLQSAVHFYNRNLLRKGMNAFRKVRDVKQLKRRKIFEFEETRQRIYLSFFISLWRKRKSEKLMLKSLENEAAKHREIHLLELYLTKISNRYRERKEERERILKVVGYSNAVIVDRSFQKWRKFTTEKNKKRTKMEQAKNFYLHQIIEKSFRKWKKYLFLKAKKQMAINYSRSCILSKSWNHWKVFLAEQRLRLAVAANLKENYNNKLLKNSFDIWRDEISLTKTKINFAATFRNKILISKIFGVWKKRTQMKIIIKSKFERNKKILNSMIVKNVIFRWHEMQLTKKNLTKKMEEVRRKHEGRIMSAHFAVWRGFVWKRKRIEKTSEVFPEVISTVLVEQYVMKMSAALKEKRISKRKLELAGRTEEKLAKRKYLKKWEAFVRWKKNNFPKCFDNEKSERTCRPSEIQTFPGKFIRRKPIIPNYLKEEMSFAAIEEDF